MSNESLTSMRLSLAVDELEKLRQAMHDAHAAFAVARKAFTEKQAELMALIAELPVPDEAAPKPARPHQLKPAAVSAKTRKHDGRERVVELLRAEPGASLDRMTEALGLGRTHLSYSILPKLAKEGIAVNRLGNWFLNHNGGASCRPERSEGTRDSSAAPQNDKSVRTANQVSD